MTRIAVIEDDAPTSDQLVEWIRAARPGVRVDQWFNRDDAEAAVLRPMVEGDGLIQLMQKNMPAERLQALLTKIDTDRHA